MKALFRFWDEIEDLLCNPNCYSIFTRLKLLCILFYHPSLKHEGFLRVGEGECPLVHSQSAKLSVFSTRLAPKTYIKDILGREFNTDSPEFAGDGISVHYFSFVSSCFFLTWGTVVLCLLLFWIFHIITCD